MEHAIPLSLWKETAPDTRPWSNHVATTGSSKATVEGSDTIQVETALLKPLTTRLGNSTQ